MNLLEEFKGFIQQHHLFSKADKLLLAVSGGVDSVVLCRLCREAGFEFSIAHCNFQLRGADSDRDEQFVAEMATAYHSAFYSVKFDTKRIAAERRIATQEAARELRYHWFEEIRSAGGYNFIVTAHHADDNIETVMMNFSRGTGIKGLKGIEPKKGSIIRPLLFARRSALEAFREAHDLSFVQDISNESDDYTRNYFRHHVIPVIGRVYPTVKENMLENIARFNDVDKLYRQALSDIIKKLVVQKGNEIHIPVLKLQKTVAHRTILYELLKDYGFHSQQIGDVLNLLESETGKYVRSASHRIIRNRQWLILAPHADSMQELLLIEQAGAYRLEGGKLTVELCSINSAKVDPSPHLAMLDADGCTFPLIVRKWQPGDYFYPLGMKKKKKLARFFIDAKLSRTEKEKVWVVEMNRKIVWVIGHRIDDRFRITDQTKKILQLTVT